MLRAVCFALVGWWTGFLWANAAASFAVTVVGLLVSLRMSLHRFHG